MQVLLAKPRGFCAGVNRAIAIVEKTLARHGPPVYVVHEIVHNTHVIARLERLGAVFVESVAEVPPGSIAVFSAHGHARAVEEAAAARGLRTIDATCPLVSKVHRRVVRLNRAGCDVLVVGHKGHPEVQGICGRAEGGVHVISSPAEVWKVTVRDPDRVGYVTQTTLSMDDAGPILEAIRSRFPAVSEPDRTDICYATTNRQEAVRRMAAEVEVVLVVGSKTSSNSNRLREVAEHRGCRAYLVDDEQEIDPEWLTGAASVGVTAGASAPEDVVERVLDWLAARFGAEVRELPGKEEGVRFAVPDLEL